MNRYVRYLASPRLSLCGMAAAISLIVFTLHEAKSIGLPAAVARYLSSTFITWQPEGAQAGIPMLPGGYLIGALLLLNLCASLALNLRPSLASLASASLKVGAILFIIGGIVSSMHRYEGRLELANGEPRSYAEQPMRYEIALVDESSAASNRVYAIPHEMLRREQAVRHKDWPFVISIDAYIPNAQLSKQRHQQTANLPRASRGIGEGQYLIPSSRDEGGQPGVLVTFFDSEEIIGAWLIKPNWQPQAFSYQSFNYSLQIRKERRRLPFEISATPQQSNGSPQRFLRITDTLSGETLSAALEPGNPLELERYKIYARPGEPFARIVSDPGRNFFLASSAFLILGLLLGLTAFAGLGSSATREARQ